MGARWAEPVRFSGNPGRAFDEELAKEEGAEVVLQVNGKVRSRVIVPFGTATRRTGEGSRWPMIKCKRFSQGKQIVKIIVVPDKLVNVVVKGKDKWKQIAEIL